tara:strand:- start:20228 stop:21076 length:849 start_codon:yes stop_codon:yes gene_type:complete
MNEEKLQRTLSISEMFYSIQCEGFRTGRPAIFIRLSNCNLSCGFSAKAVVDFKRELKGTEDRKGGDDHEYADLMKEGKASWCCDSLSVWALKKKKTAFDDIIDEWREWGVLDGVINGYVELIWTGGEPTLPGHQKDIVSFLQYFENMFITENVINQVETNGTLPITDEFSNRLKIINCSPKLANSGMLERQRIKPEVIEQIKMHEGGTFKFVISTEGDVEEFLKDFVYAFDIDIRNVCMQPGLDNFEQVAERTAFCMEMGKKYQISALTRNHVVAWDQATGV